MVHLLRLHRAPQMGWYMFGEWGYEGERDEDDVTGKALPHNDENWKIS